MTDSTQSPPGSAGSDKANAIIAWIYDLPDGFTRMSHIAPNPGEKAAPLYTAAQDALDAKRVPLVRAAEFFLDVWDDAEKHAPEDRVYVSSALDKSIAEIRAALKGMK